MEKIRDGESQKKEDAAARKGRKVMNHCVFPTFCGPGGSKSRLAEAAGAEPAGQMRDEAKHTLKSKCIKHHMLTPFFKFEMLKKCTPLWHEAHVEVNMYKTPQLRRIFGS